MVSGFRELARTPSAASSEAGQWKEVSRRSFDWNSAAVVLLLKENRRMSYSLFCKSEVKGLNPSAH